MKRLCYLVMILSITVLTGCTKSKIDKEWDAAMDAPIEDRSNVFYEKTEPVYGTSSVTDLENVAPSEPTPGMKRCYKARMSGDEDAYEEGRALGEEDRLNGTRSHEGDYDDDDYDEDYDEGYGE